MNMCRECMRQNELCVGFMDFDIIKYLDIYLRLRKPYPAKIILGENIYESIINQIRQRGIYGLRVNLMGKPVELFGMDIEIDKYCRNRIAFEGVKVFKQL